MRVNCSVCQDEKVIKILSPMWVCGVCILRSHKIDLYKKKKHKAPWIRLYKKKKFIDKEEAIGFISNPTSIKKKKKKKRPANL